MTMTIQPFGEKSPQPPLGKGGEEAMCNSPLSKGGLGGIFKVERPVITGEVFPDILRKSILSHDHNFRLSSNCSMVYKGVHPRLYAWNRQ